MAGSQPEPENEHTTRRGRSIERSRAMEVEGQIAQQARAAVAFHDFVHRAAEVDIDDIEAAVLAHARGIGHDGGVGTEKLAGNGMLFGFEIEIAEVAVVLLRGAGADYAVRAGELRHEQAAAALVADEAPEDGVGDACHGREDGGGGNGDGADLVSGRKIRDEGQCGQINLF